MSIDKHARLTPGRAAYVEAETGEIMTFAELNDASIRLSRVLRASLEVGDRVAILLENGASYFVAAWACRRSGLRFVPINWHLGFEEAAYITENSDARALITTPRLRELAEKISAANPNLELLISDGEAFGKFAPLDAALASAPAEPLAFEAAGAAMCYSSGTTGFPKGILRKLSGLSFQEEPITTEAMMRDDFGFDETAVYHHPAPLYHAAPLIWSLGAQAIGCPVIQSRRFDAEETLQVIERFGVTHAQFVPTHFVRMLQLPEATRAKYGHGSLRMVIHAAAPCPVEVKERMIGWWGPIIKEFYSASEGCGVTVVDSHEWLSHRGTVGRSITGPIHILDDAGRDLPAGEIGHVAFENGHEFEYHKDAAKTASYFTPEGWAKPGDMGWLDGEGYLYLADRASHMIISGGVNIYPQEAESVLTLHPAVRDVAVIGVPDPEFGEAVKAVVEPAPGVEAGEALAAELIALCRSKLAGFKCPRTVDFVEALPRLPSGKLLKRELRKQYWGDSRKLIA
ncbi:MAG: AMP-binding protein [Caulobacteraceae bacterium]|nr:AMP-binding protein [Caulobacteraceae bacterium]